MSSPLEEDLRNAVAAWRGASINGGSSNSLLPIQIADSFAPFLNKDMEISRLCSMHQYGFAKRAHNKLAPNIVALNLIRRAVLTSPSEAIGELHELINENMVSTSICAVIAGVSVENETRLSDNTKIKPFRYDHLPESLVSVRQPFPGMLIDGSVSHPSAVLVLESPHQPFFEDEQPPPDWPSEKVEYLLEVADRLSVAAYCAVGIMEMWAVDEDPRLPWQGAAISFRSPHWNAPPRTEPTGITADMVEFVGLFDKVSASAERSTLRLAASRFNRSCRAVSQADRALDMGIALEMLLMHQGRGSDSGNSEIRYKLASRAAWILGSSLQERLEYFDKVSGLYSDRSSAAHKGKLDAKDFLKLFARQNDHGDVLRRVFWEIGEHGFFPEWKRLVLSGEWSPQ